MKFLSFVGPFFLVSSLFASTPPQTEDQFIDSVYRSTALLYSQDESGGMHMRCTTTAIEKTPKGYTFVTASHCVGKDNEEKERVEPDRVKFFITADEKDKKEFLSAQLIAAGYKHRSDDFALFSVETTQDFPLVAIGKDVTDHSGQPVLNVASPNGLGKQVFKGIVSSPFLDRSIVFEDINWTDAMLIAMVGTNGGSSGSAIVCLSQRAICGFLVGTIAETNTVGIPVSKFSKFREAIKNNKYRWFKKPDEDNPQPQKPVSPSCPDEDDGL